MSELFAGPKYFRNVIFHRHTDRQVGWLELFYDLVYVATLIQIGNFLSDNVTVIGFGQFMVLMTVVWWAWTGETFYQNRFVVDDLIHRMMVFIQMFAVASLGISVSLAFGDLYVQFTVFYVIVRLMLVLMYVRAYFAHPESRYLSKWYIVGFSIGILVWLGSLLLPFEYHWVGWLVGIAIELLVPLTPNTRVREETYSYGPDGHHIAERFGIFTIIVLGEAFVKVLDDAQGTAITLEQILFSTGGLTVLYSLWWLYFTDTAGKIIDFGNWKKAISWIYSHLPLAAGLVAFGVGAKKLFAETINYPGDPVTEKYRLLYTAAIVMYLVALALIDLGLDDEKTAKKQSVESIVHLVSAIIVAVIGVFVTNVTATQFVGMIAVVMVAQVVYSIYQTAQVGVDQPSHEPHPEPIAGD